MKTKHQPGRQVNDVLDSSLGKKRMDEYLKATQVSFEAAVARASMLGQAANGVLAGPKVRAKHKKANIKIQTQTSHVTPAGGNVFLDLGFDTEEADRLKAEADRVISSKIAIKESLMTEVASWIKSKGLTQVEAAQVFGVTHLRVSDIINKRWTKFTIDALGRAGKRVQLLIK